MARASHRDILPIVAILVTIVAVAIAAATLNDVTTLGLGNQAGAGGTQPSIGQGGGNPDLNQSAPGARNKSAKGGALSAQNIPLTTCIPFLTTPLGLLALILGYGGFLWGMVRQYDAARASLTAYVTAPGVFILYFILTACASLPDYGNPQIVKALSQPSGGGMTSIPIPPMLLAAVFAVVFLAGIAALVLATGAEDVIEPPEEEEEEPDMAAFAEAAGRAADRIEAADADVDNAVYRAWSEMTQLLDMPDPETSTPGEFAEQAVTVGMDRDDVEELTHLFNEVRYGEKDPEAREAQAIETLRNIEDSYGSAEVDSEAAKDTASADGHSAPDDTEDE